MKLHLPVQIRACLSAVAVGLTLCSASSRAEDASAPTSPDEEDRLLYPAALTQSPAPVNLSAYTPPTKITIPSGYTEVLVDAAADITQYSGTSGKYAFRLTKDIAIEDRTASLTISSDGVWYFTSDSVDHLVSLTFSGNSADAYGGAIYGGENSTITLSDNGSVTFSGNTASSDDYGNAYGGAIYGGENSTITLSGNGSVTFSGNSASSSSYKAYGCAIYGDWYSTITLSGNGSVTFSENSASSSSNYDAYGGAIYGGYNSTITLSNNESVTFSGNTVSGDGGAIHGGEDSTITLSDNGSVTFSGNMACCSSRSRGYAFGGAICGNNCGTITLSGNESVTFSGNSATCSITGGGATGGAIDGSTITLSDNESVTFIGNSVYGTHNTRAHGGAIYGGTITLSDNGNVTFSGNMACCSSRSYSYYHYAYGGALYGGVSIRNNGSVLFEKNAEVQSGIYCLRSIYAYGGIDLSAPKSGEIRFDDSIYTDGTLSLNADFVDVQTQGGDIIFSGLHTEAHLKEVKGGIVGTEEEIRKSRTSYAKAVALYAGRLRLEDGIKLSGDNFTTYAGKSATVLLKDSSLNYTTTTFESGTTLELQGANTVTGTLRMNANSTLLFHVEGKNQEQAALTLSGMLMLGDSLNLQMMVGSDLELGKSYQLLTGTLKPEFWNASTVKVASRTYGWNISFVDLSWVGDTLWLYYGGKAATWNNQSGDRQWNISSSVNWDQVEYNYTYQNGIDVTFGNTGAGAVTLDGSLSPKSVTVNNSSGYNYIWQGSGNLSGSMKLTKKGAGILTVNTINHYTGGTAISGGTVVLGANNALGTGAVTLSNATLNMGGKITPNNLTLSGSSKILNGTNYRGNFTMNGNLLAGSSISIISGKTATLKKGNVGGSISGAGNTVINGAVTLNGGKITTNKLTIIGSGKKLTANASGLVMNKNASDITLSASGNLTSAGAITARNITLSNKAVLNAKNSAVRNITLGGKLQATDSTVNMFGNLTAGNLVLTRSTLTNNGSSVRNLSLSGALTLSSATLNHYGNISAKNVTATASGIRQTGGPTGMKLSGNLSLGSKSTLNLFGTLNAANVTLSGNSVLNNANSTVRNAVVKGKLQATNSTVNLHGNLTAGNVVLNNATLRDNGSSARAVTVTNSTSLSNNAKLNIKGYLRSKNLTLNKSSLRQHSSNNGVALTGTLTMNSGSTLTAQGALSAANMKLSGGTINLTSASFNTIKVSGTLTLSSAIDLNLGCKLTTGRNYTLISFAKSNLTRSSNLTKLLGLTGSGATLTLRSTGIILKVTNAAAWNKYLSANKTAFNKAASVVNAITPAAEETEVVEIAESSVAAPAYDRSSADMLVQSNWGVVNASRVFTDTLGNRASNSTAFGEDKSSAVWLSAMGASSRLSSDGAAAGSDYNLFGAAVGMEQQLTEKSSLGLALGESYGKVNSFTSARTKQDTLHTALYGQYSAVERSRDAVLLDWSAAYGRTESKWQGTEWEQKSVQLDARATWAHQLTADTTVSGFAGMQYFASESADIAPGIKSGSVQNLRGEIGVGIGHMATVKTRVYGELSFVGDMVRHNPTADMGGVRERGANPGRAGINFSVGGTHAINDKWSVNASYNLELMERANSHSANIGTSYKF